MLLQCYIILCAGALFVSANDEFPKGEVDEILELDDFINRAYYTPEKIEEWLADLHSQEENITSQYRPDMMQHRKRILEIKGKDPKWKNCVALHQKGLDACQTSYLDNERECLEAANKTYKEKVEVIHMLDMEIRNWRESYKYLSDTCTKNHPNDQDAASRCLIESVKRDKSDILLNHLYYKKLDAVASMPYHEINRTIEDFKKCLESKIIEFWDHDESLVRTLNTCYNN